MYALWRKIRHRHTAPAWELVAGPSYLQLERALQAYEWMVAGKGSTAPVIPDKETYYILVRGCHRRGLLEKVRFGLICWDWRYHNS